MAIGTTPLFSELSGSCGPVDFRTRRNNKIEIGKKRIPANPQSTEQTNTRNAYGRLHELWQNAAWIDKTQYNNIAAELDISPWNAFLMRHLPIMRLNPVAYWPFVEGTGNTLHDFTTNNNHGIISGASWEVYGKYDIPQLNFDGIDDYVDYGNHESLKFGTGDLTFWAWSTTLPTGHAQYPSIIAKGTFTTNGGYLFYFVNNKPKLWLDAKVNLAGTNICADNKLHQLLATKKQNDIELFIDNILDANNITPGIDIDSDLDVYTGARNAPTPEQFFPGKIKEITMIDRYLTTAENTHIYTLAKKFYDV